MLGRSFGRAERPGFPAGGLFSSTTNGCIVRRSEPFFVILLDILLFIFRFGGLVRVLCACVCVF